MRRVCRASAMRMQGLRKGNNEKEKVIEIEKKTAVVARLPNPPSERRI